MARTETERPIQQSLLDRLIDRDPASSADPHTTWTQSANEFKESVRRDLEWILNTRRIVDPAPQPFTELRRSLYHYGLPDVTSLSADAPDTPVLLMRQVQEAIEFFEPRLSNVRVAPVEVEEEGARQVRFLIEARLELDPSPELVAFDTVLDISSCKFQVR